MGFEIKQSNSRVRIGGQIEPGGGYRYYYFPHQDHAGAQLIINSIDAQIESQRQPYKFDKELLLTMCEGDKTRNIQKLKNIQELKQYLQGENLLVDSKSCYELLPMNEKQRDGFRDKFQGEDSYNLFENFVELVRRSDVEQFYPDTGRKFLSVGVPEESNDRFYSMYELREYLAGLAESGSTASGPAASESTASDSTASESTASSHQQLYLMHTGDIYGLLQNFSSGRRSPITPTGETETSAQYNWSSQPKSIHPHPRMMSVVGDLEDSNILQRKKMCFQVIEGASTTALPTGPTVKMIVQHEVRTQNITQSGPMWVFSIVVDSEYVVFKCHEDGHEGKLARSFKANGGTNGRKWVRNAKDAASNGFDGDHLYSTRLVPTNTREGEKHSEVMGHLTYQAICNGEVRLQCVNVVLDSDRKVVSVSLYSGEKLTPPTPTILKFLQIQALVHRKFEHTIDLKVDSGVDAGITALTTKQVKDHLCGETLGNSAIDTVRSRLLQSIIHDRLAKHLYTMYREEIWSYLIEIVDDDSKPKTDNLKKFLIKSGIIPAHRDITEKNVWSIIKIPISTLKNNLSRITASEEGNPSISDIISNFFTNEYLWCFNAITHRWSSKISTGESWIRALFSRLDSGDETNNLVFRALLLNALECNAVLSFGDLAQSRRIFNDDTLPIRSSCFSHDIMLFPAYIYRDCLINKIETYFSREQIKFIIEWVYGAKHEGDSDLVDSYSEIMYTALHVSSDSQSSSELSQVSKDPTDQLFRVYEEFCKNNPNGNRPVRWLIELLILNLKNDGSSDKLKGLSKLAVVITDSSLENSIKKIESHILEQHIGELIKLASDHSECYLPLSVIIKSLVKEHKELCLKLMDNTALISFFSSVMSNFNPSPLRRDQALPQRKQEGSDQPKMGEVKTNCMYAMLKIAQHYSGWSAKNTAKVESMHIILNFLLDLDLKESLFSIGYIGVINAIGIILRLAHVQGVYERSVPCGHHPEFKDRLTVSTLKLLSKLVEHSKNILSTYDPERPIISTKIIHHAVAGVCSHLSAAETQVPGSCMDKLTDNIELLISTAVGIIRLLKDLVKQESVSQKDISPCILSCLNLAIHSKIFIKSGDTANAARLNYLTIILEQIDMPVESSQTILTHLYSVVTIPDLEIEDTIISKIIALLAAYNKYNDKPSFNEDIFNIFNLSLEKSSCLGNHNEDSDKNHLHFIFDDLYGRQRLMSLLCRTYDHILSDSRPDVLQGDCVKDQQSEMLADQAKLFVHNLMSNITTATDRFSKFMDNQEVHDLLITYYTKFLNSPSSAPGCLAFASYYLGCYTNIIDKIIVFKTRDSFFNHLCSVFRDHETDSSTVIYARRVMKAFIWSYNWSNIDQSDALLKKPYFKDLCKAERFFNNPQLICRYLKVFPEMVVDFYSNYLKSCIDAWIINGWIKNPMTSADYGYAIQSIQIIINNSAFRPSCTEYNGIILRVLVFLLTHKSVFKRSNYRAKIMSYLRAFVADYFLSAGNIPNSGASAPTAGGGSSSAAPLQSHQAKSVTPYQIGRHVTITGLTGKDSQLNGIKSIIIGVTSHNDKELCVVFIDVGDQVRIPHQNLTALSNQYETDDVLLRLLLKLELSIEEDDPDLQIFSRAYIKSLVNSSKANHHAYFNFMQRLYVMEKELNEVNNLKVYNRLRIIPPDYTIKFFLLYKAFCKQGNRAIRSFIAGRLRKNLLRHGIEDVDDINLYIDTNLMTNKINQCAEIFDLLVDRGSLVSLVTVESCERACEQLLAAIVGQSSGVGQGSQDRLRQSSLQPAVFASVRRPSAEKSKAKAVSNASAKPRAGAANR